MSCGSPMPRGERIAKPAEWGNPFGRFFSFAAGWSMAGWVAEHDVNAASSRTPLDQCLLPPAHRSAQILEPSMRTRLALVALAAALSTACGEGPLVPTTGAIRIALSTIGADPDADGYAVTLDGAAPQTVGVNATLVLRDLGTGSHSVALAGLAVNCTASGENPRGVTVRAGDTVQVAFAVVCVAVTGTIEITAATSGADVDPDGYSVQVDAGTAQALAVSGTIRFEGLQAGSHTVTLAGAATNCPVAADNPRTVSVTTGAVKRDTARTTFQVTCVATTAVIEVLAVTSGIDLDPDGYTVQVDGGASRALAVSGTTRFDGLAAGSHTVTLTGAAANCPVAADNPRTLHVITGGAARDTARTLFQVTCVAVTGSIEVKAATSGVDFTANGYTVLIDVGSLAPLPVNGATTIGGLTAGDHTVRLVGPAGNCTIAGDNPPAVHVTTGGVTRDTVRTTFQLTCVRVEKIAFQSKTSVDEATIAVAYADGSNTVTLATGTGPSWSPDGAKIAFAAIDYYCDYYYYGCYYYPVGLAVMSGDGSGRVLLTNEGSDAQPTWSPDGTKLAFISSRNGRSGVYVLNAGVPTLLTNTPRAVSKPAWSPDGTRLAFTCEVDSGNSDICVINANGTGFTRLTSDPGQDAGPAWKPDGSRIAFATTRYGGAYELATMRSEERRVGKECRSRWSPYH